MCVLVAGGLDRASELVRRQYATVGRVQSISLATHPSLSPSPLLFPGPETLDSLIYVFDCVLGALPQRVYINAL